MRFAVFRIVCIAELGGGSNIHAFCIIIVSMDSHRAHRIVESIQYKTNQWYTPQVHTHTHTISFSSTSTHAQLQKQQKQFKVN